MVNRDLQLGKRKPCCRGNFKRFKLTTPRKDIQSSPTRSMTLVVVDERSKHINRNNHAPHNRPIASRRRSEPNFHKTAAVAICYNHTTVHPSHTIRNSHRLY
uniref:Uncharacterized protein n=1 Tax=Physcomitrium patens TaxID=3218 RepID=A0A2K1K280_PHYPA|nr:hypothetical protein PHYPA_012356 [Physcomitrium patens]